MQTEEIVKITRKRVAELVNARTQSAGPRLFAGHERRRSPRWPFPGAVELSPVGDDGRTRWFATCGDLSLEGISVFGDRDFDAGTALDISCHLPETTLIGRAIVRHCDLTPHGYRAGLEFDFSE